MTLNTYDSTKHHIGLKAQADATVFGFMLEGHFIQELQREGIGAPDFGGSTDLIGQTPSFARWTQDDFIGGGFQWNWGRDDAMFADSLGFIPDPQGRSLVSCPPMYHKHAFDPDVKADFLSNTPKSMFMVGGSIYLIFGHGILRYQIDTATETWRVAGTGFPHVGGGYNPDDQHIWVLSNTNVPGDRPAINRIKTDLSNPTFDASFIGPSGTNDLSGYGMTIRDSMILVHIGRKVYIGDPPDNPTPGVNGAITWTKVGRLPGHWMDSQAYNGLTYILCSDGSYQSSIVAYDGDGLLPICTFPTSFYAKCMIEYAGRIFVGGTGTDVNGGEQYAELYEVTGNSVRTVRTFSPETRTTLLNNGWPTVINDLIVHEGLLWFGQLGKRLMAYDVTSDGFFGGSEILSNANLDFQKLVSGRGRVWAFGVDGVLDANIGIYRIAQPADAGAITPNLWKPKLTTSDFAYEPGMKKRWSQLNIMHRYGNMTTVEYSLNSGGSWTTIGHTTAASGEVRQTSVPLVDVAVSEHIRFRFTLDSTDALTYHKELVAYSVSFAMLDSGKYAWSFVVNGAEEVETRDAELLESTTQTQDVSLTAVTLAGWAKDKTALSFTDVDGQTWKVQCVGYRRNMPIIGPAVSGTTYAESHHSLTLQEV